MEIRTMTVNEHKPNNILRCMVFYNIQESMVKFDSDAACYYHLSNSSFHVCNDEYGLDVYYEVIFREYKKWKLQQ